MLLQAVGCLAQSYLATGRVRSVYVPGTLSLTAQTEPTSCQAANNSAQQPAAAKPWEGLAQHQYAIAEPLPTKLQHRATSVIVRITDAWLSFCEVLRSLVSAVWLAAARLPSRAIDAGAASLQLQQALATPAAGSISSTSCILEPASQQSAKSLPAEAWRILGSALTAVELPGLPSQVRMQARRACRLTSSAAWHCSSIAFAMASNAVLWR